MSSYLQSLRERVDPEPADPLVLDLESENAGDILGALSSETAREIILELHDEPATLSEVAERVDTSRQNAQYHLKKLETVDAVRIVDTLYSEKGREMKVYAPSGEPLIIVSSEDGTATQLRETITEMLGPIIAIGLVAVALQVVAELWMTGAEIQPGDGDIDGPDVETFDTYSEIVGTTESIWTTYPGVVFFLSAMAALVLVAVWRYRRARVDS